MTYFAALGKGVGLLVLVRTHTEVLDSLAGVPLAAKQDGVRTSRRAESELVEGQGLATSLQDALLSRLGEPEGGNGELRDLQKTNIVRNGADGNDDLGVTVGRILGLLDDAGEGKGRAVRLGEEETVEERLHETNGKFRTEHHIQKI